MSKLPLKTESLDGVHAGAALHCWSKLEDSLSEVYRVLKPGKGFFATTFLTCVVFVFVFVLDFDSDFAWVWFGLIWFGLVWFGLVWFSSLLIFTWIWF